MSDVLERIGSSLVQHGPHNNRVYLMKLEAGDYPGIIGRLDALATGRGYDKIFAKVPERALSGFLDNGYRLEAAIPDFFADGSAACFLGKYLDTARQDERQPVLVEEILATARRQEPMATARPLPEGFACRLAGEGDVTAMAAVYRQVFASYPFPIHDPAFIRAAMGDATLYCGVWHAGRLAALSSAEMDPASGAAEMTDFATLPEYRGQGLALYLLRQLETAMAFRGIRSLFTIARAYSFGMNITFARNGYRFGGTLPANTNIAGALESMNVWYKSLPTATGDGAA
ncbi:putative beta-lysine N-acetyltransferase [Geotalea uraniireducens]|uniref:Beta-lysine N-acetyltransferase n=1 Tax=Geotalea uraniireducens TaxID=351604 RepID=A0ABM8EQ86_9BACT|nr:putative beta-lysine N-acetyltransferase [Geotalea uraniireducens]BDV44645.1 putative beta-lysine N-acetyltransferase [Geotalea uraniireducens]